MQKFVSLTALLSVSELDDLQLAPAWFWELHSPSNLVMPALQFLFLHSAEAVAGKVS